MELFYRRRYLFWLIRAYSRKWGRIFTFFLLIGIFLFFVALHNIPSLQSILNLKEPRKIGIVGTYTTDVLPSEIQDYISMGLTKFDDSGLSAPSASESWEVINDGRIYVFHLKKDLTFQDGQRFTSRDVNYQFKEAKITILDSYTVQFELSEPFAPFPTVVSRPIFKKGLVGLGAYRIRNIEKNRNFIKTLRLEQANNQSEQLLFRFYDTEQAVKTAFILGEVDEIRVESLVEFNGWQNIGTGKEADSSRLIVIFYNVKDSFLSSKQHRQALSYALPDNFDGKKRITSPFRQNSWALISQPDKFQHNIENAKRLLGESDESAGKITLTITTFPKYQNLALEIAKSWRELGLDIKVETLEIIPSAPSSFQVLLDDISVPPDPDQYNLWHSLGPTNITQYASQRIDKLLEDGRRTVDIEKRKEIYADFQKYLVDDAPASFLYHPDLYTVKRK